VYPQTTPSSDDNDAAEALQIMEENAKEERELERREREAMPTVVKPAKQSLYKYKKGQRLSVLGSVFNKTDLEDTFKNRRKRYVGEIRSSFSQGDTQYYRIHWDDLPDVAFVKVPRDRIDTPTNTNQIEILESKTTTTVAADPFTKGKTVRLSAAYGNLVARRNKDNSWKGKQVAKIARSRYTSRRDKKPTIDLKFEGFEDLFPTPYAEVEKYGTVD